MPEPDAAEQPWLHVVFYHPEIPGNTGNAIRLSANTGCALHLVEPLGFSLEHSQLRRAGLDYHDLASVRVHRDLQAAWRELGAARVHAFTSRATRLYTDVAVRHGDVLLFGPESTGLADDVLASPHVTDRLRLPMLSGSRSLNVANAASIAVYEAWRQLGFSGAG